MKQIILKYHFIWLVLFFCGTMQSQGVFQKANDFYQKGNYEQAIIHYNSILKDKKNSTALYYNLANSYYKTNQIAEAIFYYEKALLLNPKDKDVLNNLKIAQQKTIDETPKFEVVGWEKLISDFTGRYHHDTWGYFAVFWSILGVVVFLIYYVSEKIWLKRLTFTLIILSAVNLIICSATGFYEKDRINKNQYAIVYTNELNVKNEPTPSATSAFVLHEGTKVKVLESLEQWHKIGLSDEMIGWVNQKQIRIIK